MVKKLIFALALSSFSAQGLYAQAQLVPEQYSLEKAEDYAAYNNDVVRCVDWIINTPISEGRNIRRNVYEFLLQWTAGSPDLLISISPDNLPFEISHPDLLILFMGAWAKYAIIHKDYKDHLAANEYAVLTVLDFMESNKALLPEEDATTQKFKAMREKGTLRKHLKKALSKMKK